MGTAVQYLERTRSSVEHLLRGIQSYIAVLREKSVPVFIFDGAPDDEASFQAESERWFRENEGAFAERREIEERYFAESFAQANLCGALLQVAYMGLSLYGAPQASATLGEKKLNETYSRFFVGRTIRTLPQGLLILAGRNQYMHLEEDRLRFPNDFIFEMLATRNDLDRPVTYRDPCFDLANQNIISFSSNITAIMNWRSYETYEANMRELLHVGR